MAIFGIRQSAWNAATVNQRRVLKVFGARVDLGEPVLYRTPGGVVWMLSSDPRYDLTDTAWFGRVLGLIAQFDVSPNGRDLTRSRLATWIQAKGGVTIPDTIPDGEDPFDYTYTQNGGPAFGAARSSIPAGLTPVEG